MSPYAATKRSAEVLAHTYWNLHGISTACFRLFTVYGPRQRPAMAIYRFIDCIRRGDPVPVFGDGTSARDYTYVSDIVDGLVAGLIRRHGFEIFNLGGGEPVRLDDLLAKIAEVLGTPFQSVRLPSQPGDVHRTSANISLAQRDLQWTASVGIEEGLRKMADWQLEKSSVCL